MVEVTDFIVTKNVPHTHAVEIDGELEPLFIDDPKTLSEILDENKPDYNLFEFIQEVHIPYVATDIDPVVGKGYFTSIMRRMYNSTRPIVVLTIPKDYEGFMNNIGSNWCIICAPYARVNEDMNTEIQSTFGNIASHHGHKCQVKAIQYIPLTWDITAYKEDNELDLDAAFDGNPKVTLSAIVSGGSISNKIKTKAGRVNKDALIDSILMYTKENIKSDQAKAKELVDMIDINRSRDMALFLVIGRCMYRIFHGDMEGLELWRKASIPEVHPLCDEYYPVLETTCTYYTVHTLQHWASKDSPDKYREWNHNSVWAAIEASVMATGGHLDVAQVAYRKNPTLFISDGDSTTECKFYMFNGTYYKESGLFDVCNYLDKEVLPEYEDFLKDLGKKVDNNPENNFKELMQKKMDRCILILTSLKKEAYQQSIIKILMRLYNKPGFDNIRDANPNLTVFEDCVFDAERLVMRDGMPEDYATASTGYKFKDEWNLYSDVGYSHDDVKCVMDNLSKIIYDHEKREVIMREFAARLHASNPFKRAVIMYGPTNNAKSALTSWLGKALGPVYHPDVPDNLLYSEESHPGGASPQMEMARFARVLPQMEITDTHVLNEGLLKRFTGGGDKITYRGLFQRKIRSFIPNCIPCTVCNTYPRINGNSAALRTRICVWKLDSKFITEKDPEYDIIKDMKEDEVTKYMSDNHWYWADTMFNRTIDRTYKAFMWILIQVYIRHASRKESVAMAKLPYSIVKVTVDYFIRANIYLQFMENATKKDYNGGTCTTFSLYNAYKKWYTENVSRFGYVPMGKFIEELESMGYKHADNVYYKIVITYQ